MHVVRTDAASRTEPADDIERLRSTVAGLEREVSRVIVGQDLVVRGVTIALLAGGHVLLEGLPGLGKTLLVRTIGRALQLQYSRSPEAGSVSLLRPFVGSTEKSTTPRDDSIGWPNGSKRRSSATEPSSRVNSTGPAATPVWK